LKQVEEIDKEFTELLWKMPHHWFTEVHNGVRVMEPICYALYQAFCIHYKYEFGVFDTEFKILLPIFKREKEKYLYIMKIKQVMLERVRKIKSEEENFKPKEWENVNFSRTDAKPGEKPKHVSDVVPENLNEEDFVRYFEYIILMRADIVAARVNKAYFQK
jgi:hypothetical protein